MNIKTRKPLLTIMFLAAAACSITVCSSSCLGQSDIQKALTVSKGIGDRNPALATKYINPTDFKQHNLEAYDGIDMKARRKL